MGVFYLIKNIFMHSIEFQIGLICLNVFLNQCVVFGLCLVLRGVLLTLIDLAL